MPTVGLSLDKSGCCKSPAPAVLPPAVSGRSAVRSTLIMMGTSSSVVSLGTGPGVHTVADAVSAADTSLNFVEVVKDSGATNTVNNAL